MQFKMKALVAAVALASSVGANATINNFGTAEPGGSLMFTLWNEANTVSALFDLGLDTNTFTPANFSTAGIHVEWNLLTGTVTGSANVASFLTGVSGSWATAYNDYSANLAGSVYSVFAGDRPSATASTQTYLSTSSSTAEEVAATTNSQLLGFNTIANYPIASNLLGNHQSVANGGNVSGNTTSYQGSVGSLGANWNNKAPFFNTAALDQDMAFYQLKGVAGSSLNPVAVNDFGGGSFSFNADTGVLVYTTPVPEPEQFAMLLAGLGMIGAIARRRAAK